MVKILFIVKKGGVKRRYGIMDSTIFLGVKLDRHESGECIWV